MTAGRFMGRGDKNAADKAAVDAMRIILNTIEMSAIVVLGEGEKDEAPMLFRGEHLGAGGPPEVDLAVDPIDGTRPLALGLSNSIATVAISPRGTMFNPGPIVYMNKIAVGPIAKDVIDIDAPVSENLKRIAKAKGEDVEHLTAVILDRPRHADLIAEVRRCGTRIKLIPDGDVAGALMTAWPQSEIDVLLGIGGTPEGILAACGLRAMGGNIQGKLYARNDEELKLGRDLGYDFNKMLTINDMVSSEDVFFAATGITRGDLLDGVSYFEDSVRTDSLVMRGLTGTVRQILSTHQLEKLSRISQITY
jgi:fructose-1,6-bisphosphatase II